MEEEKQPKLTTPMAIVLAGVIVALAIIVTQSGSFGAGTVARGNGNNPQPPREITVKAPSADDHWYGSRDAKFVVIEFSDLECPFCKSFHPTIKRVVDESKGEVALAYRHFPLDQIHSKARKEAEAAECAAELGGNDGFWKFVDRLFAVTPSNDGLLASELPKIATFAGLDAAKFNACLSSGKYADKVEVHYQDGLSAGVSGTPTSVIVNVKTGKKTLIVGAQPYEAVKQAIASVK